MSALKSGLGEGGDRGTVSGRTVSGETFGCGNLWWECGLDGSDCITSWECLLMDAVLFMGSKAKQ